MTKRQLDHAWQEQHKAESAIERISDWHHLKEGVHRYGLCPVCRAIDNLEREIDKAHKELDAQPA